MIKAIFFAAFVCAASAGSVLRASEYVSPGATIVRAPAHDSAVIEHHRLGGSFAYRTAEAPAYAQINPIIRKETIHAGTSYSELPSTITRNIIPQPAQVHRSYETVAQPAIVQETRVAQPIVRTVGLGYADPLVASPLVRSAGLIHGAPLVRSGLVAPGLLNAPYGLGLRSGLGLRAGYGLGYGYGNARLVL